MRVAAIVVAWNSADDLPACLQALDAQDHDAVEVVVVDNASADGTSAVLATWTSEDPSGRRRRVVTNPTNRGFAGGVNDGLAVLGADVEAVLLVNPDARAAPDLVRRLVAVLAADAGVGSVQPRLLRPGADGAEAVIDSTGHVFTRARLWRNRGEGEPAAGRYLDPEEIFGASGALVLHRRAMLDDVAWWHPDGRREVLTEDLFAFFDDVELDWRAQLLGWRARYEPGAVGIHERGGAGPRRTVQVEALNASNRLLVIVTCDDGRSVCRAAPVIALTTGLKLAELAVTVPRAVGPALARLRLVGAARQRRRQLRARARVPFGSVPARWAVRFRFGPWIRTWWRRVGPAGAHRRGAVS
ncbi:MAG: glycosyltransferase family 2 protein [Nitriliruptoraceae bacterium]|nr:glycosyltransferase family 2 protein [Nitriliruptoraceae bacterium]